MRSSEAPLRLYVLRTRFATHMEFTFRRRGYWNAASRVRRAHFDLGHMTVLPITNPSPASRETVYSYLSRLAATWRTDVADLAYDMGASFRKFTEQDPAAFEALAAWAGLDPHQLNEMLSWTGVRAGNVRMDFRGEVFVTRALRNPVMRGCPVCLREDAADHAGSELTAMIMRGDWQMREAVTCVRHRHPLIPLWKADRPRDRHDVGARLSRDSRRHPVGRPRPAGNVSDPPTISGSMVGFRMAGMTPGSRDSPCTPRRPSAGSWGRPSFVRTGPGKVVRAAPFTPPGSMSRGMARLTSGRPSTGSRRRPSGPLDEPAKAFGPMYTGLSRDNLTEDGFAPYRRILRECVLDHWPIAPGDVLLGEVVAERRLHSLVTAAKEIGVGAQVIAHFLIEAGALPEQDVRPPSRRVFDARAHSALLAEIPTLVGPIAMREAMGATRQELVALEEEGILAPRTRVAKVKNPWRISDGVTLVAGLEAGAVPVAEDDAAWETPLLARKRTGVSLADLIGTIREGRLAGRAAGGSSRVSRGRRLGRGTSMISRSRSGLRKTPLTTIRPGRSPPPNSVSRWACATMANSSP